MKFDDEFDYEEDYEDDYSEGGYKGGAPIVYMTLGVSVFILIILGVIIASNGKNKNGNSNYANYVASLESEESSEEEVPVNQSKRTADDLDIWDMYKNRTGDDNLSGDSDAGDKKSDEDNNSKPLPSPLVSPQPTMSPGADDEKYNDGKHFKIEYSDGSSEWVTIDASREKNNYDFTKLISNDGKLKYYNDGKLASFLGIDVSRYQKDIDFNQVKSAGIEFVMIRVGARGYQTGQISLDEYFAQNMTRARDAGLDIGVYFYSQAVNEAEALEEANLVIEACKDYKLTYPVAFDMEFIDNDISRVESLSKDDRTLIAGTFLNRIVEAGYKPMIYGDKEWLVKRIDIKKLPVASVWLADESDMPDYPYQFSMWQYSTDGNVYGVSTPVDMDICFIDYSAQ